MAPHGVASPLATMAYAHVCLTAPNHDPGMDHYLDKQYTSLTNTVQLKDGYLGGAGQARDRRNAQ